MAIFYIMLAYLIGIIMGLYFKSIALFILLFICILTTFKLIKISKKQLVFLLIIFIISLTRICILEKSFENVYKDLEELNISQKQQIEIQAIVVSNKKEKEYQNIYKIKIEKINGSDKYKGIHLQLSLKNKSEKIEYGDCIFFKGEYEKPQIARNYKGFDYSQYLKSKKIYGIISTSKIQSVEKEAYNKALIYINRVASKIEKKANIILEKNEMFKGVLTENYVACELYPKFKELHYFILLTSLLTSLKYMKIYIN